ncbi:MAG: hypothetical protein ACLUS6_02635 [Dysosmobacter sp.]
MPKLKALLEQFEVQDIGTAMLLTEHLADYILTPKTQLTAGGGAWTSSRFIMDREEAVRLIPSCEPLQLRLRQSSMADNAALTSYGLLHRADYEPMLSAHPAKTGKGDDDAMTREADPTREGDRPLPCHRSSS